MLLAHGWPAGNHDGLGWHLRGLNALRMIGISHEVVARLLRAEQDCELQGKHLQEGRPDLADGQPAPLTNTQLDDILGERSSRTRAVLGNICYRSHRGADVTARPRNCPV